MEEKEIEELIKLMDRLDAEILQATETIAYIRDKYGLWKQA